MKKVVNFIRNKSEFMTLLSTFGIYEMPEKRNLYYFYGAFWSEPRNWEEFLQEVARAKADLVMIKRLQEKIKENNIAPEELEKIKDRLNYHMTEYYDVMWDLFYAFIDGKDYEDFLISDKEDRQNYTFNGKCYY